MSELVELIKKSEYFCCLGGVNLSQVVAAEQELGLTFAEDYKEYILEFGAASFSGHELTGMCDSERLSVISTTEKARAFFSGIPNELYVIEDLYFDHVLVVQDSSGAVYYYGPEDEKKKVANSLKDYLFY